MLIYYFSIKPGNKQFGTVNEVPQEEIYQLGNIEMFANSFDGLRSPDPTNSGSTISEKSTPQPTSNKAGTYSQIGGYIEQVNTNDILIKVNKTTNETKKITFPAEGVVFLKAELSENKSEQKIMNATSEDKINYYKVGQYVQLTVNQMEREDGSVNNFAIMILLYPEQPTN